MVNLVKYLKEDYKFLMLLSVCFFHMPQLCSKLYFYTSFVVKILG